MPLQFLSTTTIRVRMLLIEDNLMQGLQGGFADAEGGGGIRFPCWKPTQVLLIRCVADRWAIESAKKMKGAAGHLALASGSRGSGF